MCYHDSVLYLWHGSPIYILIFISSHGKACDHHLAFPLSLVFRSVCQYIIKVKQILYIKIQLMKYILFFLMTGERGLHVFLFPKAFNNTFFTHKSMDICMLNMFTNIALKKWESLWHINMWGKSNKKWHWMKCQSVLGISLSFHSTPLKRYLTC